MTEHSEDGAAAGNAMARAAETRSNVRKMSVAMFLALAILGVLNSAALERYAGDFSGSVVAEEALVRASEWNALMQQWGLTRPREILREEVDALRALRFMEE